MGHTKNVTPAKANGVRATGNNPPLAKMPANNVGAFPVKLGTSHNSAFGNNTGPSKTVGAVKQGSSTKANMPAKNGPDNKAKLGHTKHGVGEVPGYLKSY